MRLRLSSTVPGDLDVADLSLDRVITPRGGGPTVTFHDLLRHKYDLCASSYGDLNRPGALHLGLTAWCPRDDSTGAGQVSLREAAINAAAGQAMSAAIEEHFG